MTKLRPVAKDYRIKLCRLMIEGFLTAAKKQRIPEETVFDLWYGTGRDWFPPIVEVRVILQGATNRWEHDFYVHLGSPLSLQEAEAYCTPAKLLDKVDRELYVPDQKVQEQRVATLGRLKEELRVIREYEPFNVTVHALDRLQRLGGVNLAACTPGDRAVIEALVDIVKAGPPTRKR